MTYAANHKNLASYVSYNAPKRNVIAKKFGILRRIFGAILDAMHESRRRQAEREIANFVARRGGRITDDLEREMMRRLFTSNWRAKALPKIFHCSIVLFRAYRNSPIFGL
jgi:hypothetical protein